MSNISSIGTGSIYIDPNKNEKDIIKDLIYYIYNINNRIAELERKLRQQKDINNILIEKNKIVIQNI